MIEHTDSDSDVFLLVHLKRHVPSRNKSLPRVFTQDQSSSTFHCCQGGAREGAGGGGRGAQDHAFAWALRTDVQARVVFQEVAEKEGG